MADKKVTALTALTAASNNDILMIVDDPLGTPISKKITVEDVFGNTTKTTLNKIHIGSSNTNITGTTLTLYPGTGGQSSNVSVQGSIHQLPLVLGQLAKLVGMLITYMS